MPDLDVNRSSSQPALPRGWGRPLAGLGAALLALSTLFPVVASAMPAAPLPAWVGYVDVALAFAVVLLGLVLVGAAGTEPSARVVQLSFSIYRAAATLLLVLLALFFVAGDRLLWNVLLPGLAWRGWLFVLALPAGLTIWSRDSAEG